MTRRNPSDPYLGAFLGLACGDALGAPVEFMSKPAVAALHGELSEMVGGGRFGWAPGEWTDDTGMALSLAEGILASPADPVEEVGRRFIAWGEAAADVGNTIRAALNNAARHKTGQPDWAEASQSTPQGQPTCTVAPASSGPGRSSPPISPAETATPSMTPSAA